MVQPIGPLMIEHRLIERMISAMRKESRRLDQGEEPNLSFIDTAVDFVQTYADACHHGKEEDILFRALESVAMDADDEKIKNELIEEHEWARKKTSSLVKANEWGVHGGISVAESLTPLIVRDVD